VDRFVAERALNHKLKGIEGTYDRHDYLSERADALRVWAAALAALSRGEKVANAHDRAARKSPTPNAVVQR
jgi:hypothetical protein